MTRTIKKAEKVKDAIKNYENDSYDFVEEFENEYEDDLKENNFVDFWEYLEFVQHLEYLEILENL